MTTTHRSTKLAAIVGFVIGALGLFYFLYHGAGGQTPLSSGYRVTATLHDPFELVQNSDVREAGITIGHVTGIDAIGDRSDSQVTMDLSPAYAPLYRNATVLLRTKTLVGEQYVQITPGDPAAGRIPDGGTLPLRRDSESVQLDQIFSAFNQRTRAAIQRNLDGLGPGFASRSADVNQLFGGLHGLTANGTPVVSVLAADRSQVANLVQNTGIVMQALANRTTALRSLVITAKQTAQAVAARDAELGRTFAELPATLDQARTTIGRLDSFAGDATPVVASLRQSFTALAPTIRDLRPSARAGRQIFAQLPPFVRAIDPVLQKLHGFATAVRPMASALGGFDAQLGPMVTYLTPYAPDIGALAASDYHQYADTIGHLIRIFNYVDSETLAVLLPAQQQAIRNLEKLGDAIGLPRLDQNSYPSPGSAGNPQPFSGSYPHVLSASKP